MKESNRVRKDAKAEKEPGNASKPVSLAPLTFDEALGGLLETDAEAVRRLEREAAVKRAKNKKK